MLVPVIIRRVVEILGAMRRLVREGRQLAGVAERKENDEQRAEPPTDQSQPVGGKH